MTKARKYGRIQDAGITTDLQNGRNCKPISPILLFNFAQIGWQIRLNWRTRFQISNPKRPLNPELIWVKPKSAIRVFD